MQYTMFFSCFCSTVISVEICLGEQTRPAVITLLKSVGLAGKDGIVSDVSPGVFVQVWLIPFLSLVNSIFYIIF